MTDTALVKASISPSLQERSIDELVARAEKIKEAMEKVFIEDHHYGIIPGVKKPSLFKAGAEKLTSMFLLDPEITSIEERNGDHLTVKSTCTIYHIPTGLKLASASGSCSTKENKYAFRDVERECPACNQPAIFKSRDEKKPGWFCWKKRGGCGVQYAQDDPQIASQKTGKIPNDALPDTWNTVLKMAEKRALVAAVLIATSASDIFTQDVEDTGDNGQERKKKSAATVTTIPDWTKDGKPHPLAGKKIADLTLDHLTTLIEGLRTDKMVPGKAKDAKYQVLLEALEGELERRIAEQQPAQGELT